MHYVLLSAVLTFGWPISETGIYRKIRLDEVTLRPDGALYLVDYDNATLHLYSQAGERVTTFGGKGNGPGDLLFPTSLGYEGDTGGPGRLFVYDSGNYQISIFDDQGTFIKRLRVPDNIQDPVRVRGGWVYGDWDRQQKPAHFYHANQDFTKTRVLQTIPDPGRGGGLTMQNTEGGLRGNFGGIRRRPHFKVDRQRDRVYLVDATRFVISVFQASTGEPLNQIERMERPMPFDDAWGEHQLSAVLDKYPQIHRQQVVTDFPEYFPAIRSMRIDPDGYLVINRWRGNPDERFYTIILNHQGKVMPGRYSWDAVRRLVGEVSQDAYILTFDIEADEAGIARVPVHTVEEFIIDNPIPPGSVYRQINRSQ